MKFSKWGALEKHLQETPSFANVFLIACSHETDRREIGAKIISMLQNRQVSEAPLSVIRFTGNAGFAGAFAELQTENLFAARRVVVIDEIDKLKEEESAYIRRWVQNPFGKILLLLGIENTRALTPFLPLVKAEVLLLDLLQEKPWERQQRLLDDLRATARAAKIIVEEDVWDFLIHQVGNDWTLLKNEVEKLLSYGSQRKKVSLEEARSIIASTVFPEGWALAEQLVFSPYTLSSAPFLDASALLSLLGQLRYYLRLGWQLSMGQEKTLKPYQVQKYGDKAREKGTRFFEEGLLALNDVEALAKSSSVSCEILLHRFAIKLHTIRK